MTSYYGKRDRRVIPRWRMANAAIATPEGQPINAKLPQFEWSNALLAKLAQEWVEKRKVFVASELVGAAFTLRVWKFAPAMEAATFLINQKKNVPSVAWRVATEYISGPRPIQTHISDPVNLEQPIVFKAIHGLKKRLITEPRNVIARVDLARYYASIGQKDRAAFEMKNALSLAPSHRFVTRSVDRNHFLCAIHE